MSYLDEYNKLKKKRLEEEEEKKSSSSGTSGNSYMDEYNRLKSERTTTKETEDIAPVRTTVTKTEEKEEDEDRLFSLFDDGWDQGDLIATIDKGARKVGNWLGNTAMSGLASFNKGITSTADIILGKPLQAMGWEDNPISSAADYYDEQYGLWRNQREEATKELGGGAGLNFASDVVEGSVAALPDAILAYMTAGASTVGSLSTQAAYHGGSLLAKAGLTVESMIKKPSFWMSFARTYGSDYEEAKEAGADDLTATFGATISSLINSGIEIGTDGMSGIQGLPKDIKDGGIKPILAWAESALEEGGEEVLQGFVNNAVSKAMYDSNTELANLGEMGREFALGTAVGGLLGGGQVLAQQGINSHNEQEYTLTENEQKVVDKIYEDRVAEAEKNGKVSKNEKAKIYEDVLTEMEKGYISTDTIEEVLGGESYNTYKSTIDNEQALRQEFDTLNKMKQGEMTGEQIDRRAELKQQLADLQTNSQKDSLKSKLSEEVFGLVKGDRLGESYNQMAMRGQAFEADLTKYDTKQQETIKKAVESGVLNNTRRTHEFVDMIAKISADKGVLFDFTNNQKLKESGFAVDGKQVNGFVDGEGKITLNTQSAKYLNSVVGHEVTHVLEGTDLYQVLQDTVFEYAKSKGEYQARYDALMETYKGIDGADINAELTADLVGDYLFMDSDFINNLSTKNRNVFQKIYDEIKYLCKVATAGSKEARDLEKVKKAFEDAYRANGKANTDTKYSMSDTDGKQLSKEQQDYFKDSKMRDENGNLMVMYHGSQDAGFHTFDSQMSDDGTSFFFVDRNDVAASYSGTSETYEAKTIRTPEDMNNFLAEIGYDHYEAVERNGKFELLENNEHVATKDTMQEIYEEFCWYEGVGDGDANYKVYLNLKNPLVVDAEGRNWNRISGEFSQEIYDRYQSLTDAEKESLVQLASWEDASIFRDEVLTAVESVERGASYVDEHTRNIASAAEKLGDADMYRLFDIAVDGFSEESLRENAVNYLKTRDYAQRAKEQGYDGVIFKNIVDNGGFSDGKEGASTVAIAFDSNQIKSTANQKPTADPDIRYSLTEYTDEEKKAHNNLVLEHFGSTYKWAETGYVLLDGSRLDLSGKHEGAPGGYRTVDHRDIVDALGSDYGDDTYSGSLVQFMSEGNIRISPESNGINLSVKPNKAQEMALSNFVSYARGEVMLDIDDQNGYTVVSVEYPRGTHANKVLNDIREWFENGTKPEVPNASPFRYSLSEPAEYAPTFYSQMAKVVDDTRQQKLGAASVVNMLRGKGVKAEEIKWSGIEEWLDGKKSVTKEELQDFIKGSQLQIEETVLADEDSTISYTEDEQHDLQVMSEWLTRRMDQAKELWQEAYGEEIPLNVLFADDTASAITREIIDRNGGIRGFRGVDGMSEAERTLYTEVTDGIRRLDLQIANIRERAEARQKNTSNTHWSQYKLDGGDNYREYLFKMPGSDYRNQAMDTHWQGETGVLAHARVQDFDTADGKMLFIEEIQSDWHNEGAKIGYADEQSKGFSKLTLGEYQMQDNGVPIAEVEDAYGNTYAYVMKPHEDLYTVDFANGSYFHSFPTEEAALGALRRNAQMDVGGTPDAPFRNNYHEYVLKRLIREAAEKGYSRIGWTTGQMQERRWSSDYAEGYRIEYDQDIPSFLKKYGKKWGATVGKTRLINADSYKWDSHNEMDRQAIASWEEALAEARNESERNFIRSQIEYHQRQIDSTLYGPEVPSFEINDAMKQSVLYEGQPQYSISEEGEAPKKYGNYAVSGKDIALEAAPEVVEQPVQEEIAPSNDVAPVPETVSKTETVEPVAKEDLFPNDLAPIQSELSRLIEERAVMEEKLQEMVNNGDFGEDFNRLSDEWDVVNTKVKALDAEMEESETGRFDSLSDADAPPEMEAPYPGVPSNTQVENPFADRNWYEVGNRKVKAYMYENPEVKPFFQDEARNLWGELNDTQKGERYYSAEAFNRTGNEDAWTGVSRFTSDSIAEMLDSWHMSYADIEKGLKAIVEDNGAENIAAAKKIEFMLNDRLLNGYKDFYSNGRIPPNQDYINLLNEKQINEYSEEAFNRFMETADQYAPPVEEAIAPVAEVAEENTATQDIAPVAEKYEAIRPKREPQPKLIRVDNADSNPKGKQRKWVKTSTKSEVVDRKVLPKDLDQDLIHYQPISNKKTLGNANAKLDRMGYEHSVAYFESQFDSNKVTLDDIALGERLIQEAVKNGDTKTAGDLIMDISILGTELGQKVQALSIIKRLTPEGQLRMLQRTVQRGKTKGDKAYNDVTITQDMIDKILSAYGKDGTYDQAYLNEMVEDVKQQIADQMKVTAMDKVNAWRYLSMLGNPKTHIRNLVSNVAMRGTVAAKNVVARTIETIAPIENRTKTWRMATKEVKAFAKRKTIEMQGELMDGGKYNEDASIKQKREIFKTKILNGVYEFNSDMLSKEDWWFSKPAFQNALSEFLTANGIRTEQDIKSNPKITAKAIQYATEQSQIATFRQYSWLANKINEIERKNAATNIAVGAILPFKKTPINIAKTGLSYSPLGFVKTLTYDAVQVRNGNMEASELIDHLAQNVTGTALTLVGYMLASSGFLNGAGDDDKEGDYDYQLGKQAYSVNIGDATFSLSWLSPVAMPLFVGANAYEQLVEGKEWNGDVVVETLAQTLDPLSEMSFISSLDSVLSSYDSGFEKFAGIGETMAQNYITQFVPTLSSQIATVMDDTKRTTKVAANSDFKFFDETINNLKYKIPGLRQLLEPTTDIWGNEVKQSENVLERAFETFLAPYARRENIATAVDEEIKDLYRQTGDSGVIPSVPYNSINYDGVKYEMSATEFTTFKKQYGQTALDLMEQLFDTKTYQNADSETRADMVNRVYDYANDEAKKAYFANHDLEFTNATEDGKEVYKEDPIKGAIENDLPVDEYVFSTDYPEKYSFFKENGISYDTYAAADEDGKRAYSWAFENPGKYTMSKAISDDFMTYYQYKSDCNNFDAKDENGETVSGLKKERVLDYINDLDLDYGQKIILFRSMYDSKDDKANYNADIVDYLNSREDISYEEMETILKELGFNVSSDGTVTWD